MSNGARLAAYGLVLAAALGAGTLLGSIVGDPPAEQNTQEHASHSPAEQDTAGVHGGEH